MQLAIFAKSKPEPPPYDPKPCPDYEVYSDKTIQFILTDYIVRSALDAAFNAHYMLLQHSFVDDTYNLTLYCNAKSPPTLSFNEDIFVNATGECRISGFNKNSNEKYEFGIETDFINTLNENITDGTLYFTIVRAGLQNMKFINPNNHDLKWFAERINAVLKEITNAINILLGARGIQLPKIPGIDYSDIKQAVKDGYMEALVTPIIHIQ